MRCSSKPLSVKLSDLVGSVVKALLIDHAGTLTTDKIETLHGAARAALYTGITLKEFSAIDGARLRGYGELRLFEQLMKHEEDNSVLPGFEKEDFKPIVKHFRKNARDYAKAHNAIYSILRGTLSSEDMIREGMPELVENAWQKNIPVAIVSNSERNHVLLDSQQMVASINLKRVSNGLTYLKSEELFKFILASQDMLENKLNVKPSPDGYKWAFKELKKHSKELKKPEQTLILEDSNTGIMAGLNFGAPVLHVYPPNTEPHPKAAFWAAGDKPVDRVYVNPENPTAMNMYAQYIRNTK